MTDRLWRARNAARRLLAGLPPVGGPPFPEAPTAVYRVLASLYRFAGGFVAGEAVVDWGCGTGFGSAHLIEAGARSVMGLDPAPASIRYARRRFRRPGLELRVAELDLASAEVPAAGRWVAVDVLGRLADPEPVLSRLAAALPPEGVLIASLPPVLDGPTLELHRARHPEAARLFLWDWADLLGRAFREVRLFGHHAPPGVRLDLASPRPSPLDPAAFRFEEVPLADLDNVGSLGAVFVASGPAG
ncbi:MAG TPA: methyltransferase domain-containing protein [Thermoanaerobaculia bacterium]|nr:methyltransferase domain-containing protein [Thermoanaerobaculia bacterium]